jgi:hypothetical protein
MHNVQLYILVQIMYPKLVGLQLSIIYQQDGGSHIEVFKFENCYTNKFFEFFFLMSKIVFFQLLQFFHISGIKLVCLRGAFCIKGIQR